MIDNKWKRFAIYQILSDWDELQDASNLYDVIAETANDDLVKIFDEYNVAVWQPFEDWTLTDIVNLLTEMATRAQETANDE